MRTDVQPSRSTFHDLCDTHATASPTDLATHASSSVIDLEVSLAYLMGRKDGISQGGDRRLTVTHQNLRLGSSLISFSGTKNGHVCQNKCQQAVPSVPGPLHIYNRSCFKEGRVEIGSRVEVRELSKAASFSCPQSMHGTGAKNYDRIKTSGQWFSVRSRFFCTNGQLLQI